MDFPLMRDGSSIFDGNGWVLRGFAGARSLGTVWSVPFGGVNGDIIADEAFGGKRAALDVAGKVTQGGAVAACVLKLDIPGFGR
jgi:hypothetical protein